MKLKYLKELDGIRAIAARMVMFFHFSAGIVSTDKLLLFIKKISIFGQTGVSLFFVLSGFLITRILLVSKDKTNYFYNFYIRRVLRIFPLYYLFLSIFYFLVPIFSKTPIVNFYNQFYYWIYMQDFAMTFNWDSVGPLHFWSLAIEEHFYLFWPFLIYFFNTNKIIFSIIGLLLISVLVRVLLISHHYEVFYFTFSRMDELAFGALLAILEMKNILRTDNSKKFILLFIVVMVPTIIIWSLNNASGNAILQIFKFILLSVAFFSFIGYVVTSKESNLFKRFLKLKPFSFSGKISYGLYVYHPLCFFIFNKFFSTNYFVVNLVGSFICTYIVATISYYLIESQFLKLKERFNYSEQKIILRKNIF